MDFPVGAEEYAGTRAKLPFEFPRRIWINEVGPRDGFQLEKKVIPTASKIDIVNALSLTGVPGVQVTSFVRAEAVPQLQDADQVMAGILRNDDVEYAVLIPNVKGGQRAIAYSADVWETMLSVSDSHSLANANRKTDEALRGIKDVVDMGHDAGVEIAGGMATALGCPFEGRISYDRVSSVVSSYLNMGVRRVTLADTAGVADPAHVYAMSSRLISDFPEMRFSLHLHDTRGLGLANVIAGMAAGVVNFDSSIGGLGGCPYAPGATGNIATEDLVHMLDLMRVESGVDLQALLSIARGTIAKSIDHPLESSLSRADPSWFLHPAPTVQKLRHE